MRYEKPVVMGLGSRARAAGDAPLGCVPGAAADPYVCAEGTSAYPTIGSCSAGPTPGTDFPPVCGEGSAAFYACVGGSSPTVIEPCTVGVGPNV
jgi:hypothetical protein